MQDDTLPRKGGREWISVATQENRIAASLLLNAERRVQHARWEVVCPPIPDLAKAQQRPVTTLHEAQYTWDAATPLPRELLCWAWVDSMIP
jgi:hypothetical protein